MDFSSGIVESVEMHLGQTVSRGDELLRFISLDQVKIEFQIDNSEVFPPSLLGQPATVELIRTSAPIKLKGLVTYVSSEIDLNNNVYAWAICDNVKRNGHWVVRSGMTGSITVGIAPDAKAENDQVHPQSTNVKLLDELRTKKIEYLEELLESQNRLVKDAQSSYNFGIGNTTQVKMANRDLWLTKAQLAATRHDSAAAHSAYRKAIELAKSVESLRQTAHHKGREGVNLVLEASRMKTEISLEYLKFQVENEH